jgi:nitrite reductase/ring-hydroxylating ferredoxin subunit
VAEVVTGGEDEGDDECAATRRTVLRDAIAPGAIVDLEIDGVEVVVWRAMSGRLCATDARCPHQWSHFAAEGAIDGDELVCTAHFWRFDGDGAGCRIDGKGVREPMIGLAVYRVVESADGSITVSLDPGETSTNFGLSGT